MSEAEHTPISENDYIVPSTQKEAFHCPHCGVLARQTWQSFTYNAGPGHHYDVNVRAARCFNCRQHSIWMSDVEAGRMIEPQSSNLAPRPHADMPDDVRRDYNEARMIVQNSPRGAAALLRLSVQKLCVALGEKGKNLDDDIASLVRKGLDPEVGKALDVLRVVGNNAVHPGEIALDDDVQTATSLFGLVNFTVEQRITRPKKLAALFDNLPEGALQAIERRDGKGGAVS